MYASRVKNGRRRGRSQFAFFSDWAMKDVQQTIYSSNHNLPKQRCHIQFARYFFYLSTARYQILEAILPKHYWFLKLWSEQNIAHDVFMLSTRTETLKISLQPRLTTDKFQSHCFIHFIASSLQSVNLANYLKFFTNALEC